MAKFFPALAHTDSVGYLDERGKRNLMSVLRLLPENMQKRALMSLSFDESIHYDTTCEDGDKKSPSLAEIGMAKLEEVFVDCGAFHYSKLSTPKFLNGGFVRSSTTIDEWKKRHMSRNIDAQYLICSPDHIIHSDLSEEEVIARREFTRLSAKSFLQLTSKFDNVTPIAVVHGRNIEERTSETEFMIGLGYKYIAFGGLVPLARDPKKVLHQIAGIEPLAEGDKLIIKPESPLGMLKKNGIKSHMFGLNSPEWYRWWKRLGVDSFDGSKLSQEGAANGIIWKVNQSVSRPKSAKDLYNRLQIKKINSREWNKNSHLSTLVTSPDGTLDLTHAGWKYLQTARCTSPNCPAKDIVHNCDPRVTGSIEHNMGRMIVNAYAFEEIMRQIDTLHERANLEDCTGDKKWLGNWKTIEVGK